MFKRLGMTYEIESVLNGYTLSWDEELNDGSFRVEKKVFEERSDIDENLSECKAFLDLLLELAEIYCPYCKHNKYNVSVNLEKDGKIVEDYESGGE